MVLSRARPPRYPFPNLFFFFQQPTKVSSLIKESSTCPSASHRRKSTQAADLALGMTDPQKIREILHLLERNPSSCSLSTKGLQNTMMVQGKYRRQSHSKKARCVVREQPRAWSWSPELFFYQGKMLSGASRKLTWIRMTLVSPRPSSYSLNRVCWPTELFQQGHSVTSPVQWSRKLYHSSIRKYDN